MKPTKRQRRLAAQRELTKVPARFQQIDLSTAFAVPKWMTRAYRNNRFTVMVAEEQNTTHSKATRILIQAHDAMPIKNHWRELQAIKNEIFGTETVAVEYYPAQSELIDDHNIYWLWIYPPDVLPKPILNK